MNVKTEAIVLNKIKYSDNSYITNIFSRETGKTAVFLRAAKSNKAAYKPGQFFPLNVVDVELTINSVRNIQNLKHCSNVFSAYNMCSDVYKSSVAQFIAELMSKALSDNQTDKDLYDYLRNLISQLENPQIPSQNMHLLFLKDFAKYLGFEITNNHSESTPFFNLREGMFLPVYTTDEESMDVELSELFSNLLELHIDNIRSFNTSYANRKKLLSRILLYYRIHIDNFPEIKSIKVLNEVFSD
jgi:DNA repair protein RecO (recombination protein O)